MSDAAAELSSSAEGGAERRSNQVLRALVSDMLEEVRKLSRRAAAWEPEERAQAEAELERIMARVRREAAHAPGQ